MSGTTNPGGLKLKLTFGNKSFSNGVSTPTPGTQPTPNSYFADATPTPASATPGGSKPRILKFTTNSTPSTPAPAPAPTPAPAEEAPKQKKTKAGRATKPSAKLIESKKRIKEESDDEEDSTIQVQHPSKKIKLQLNNNLNNLNNGGPKTPIVQLKGKYKGKAPIRPPGEGYDSEASDVERDPVIEEQFVLRMYPGEDCEYLRNAIADRKIGIPKSQGGADIHMKFYQAEGRRGVVTIRGNHYAASLVDLPCVIEGMKSWDKRGWWKSADVCQMLWVFQRVVKEEDAKTIPLPKIIDPQTYQYPHGLTPPMHYARKRRFRKRISRTAIEAVEDAVEKLLEADAKAESSRWEMIQPDLGRGSAYSESERGYEQDEYSQDEDAEGDLDDNENEGYFGMQHGNSNAPAVDMDELEADLAAAFEEQDSLGATPMSTLDATQVVNGEIPAGEDEPEDDSGDESIEGDEDEDAEVEGTAEIDEAEKARQIERQGILEDIADMEKSLEDLLTNLQTTQNNILRARLEVNIRKVKTELQLKKSSIGEDEG
jgi:transcription initiation factor TFIID subunit 7